MNNPEDAVEYAPYVMAHFLNEWSPEGVNLHTQPYCDIGCNRYPPYTGCFPPACPDCVYRYVDIRITVDCNIENIEDGGSASPTAQVWVEVVNNSDLQTGNEDWHNVSGLLKNDASVGKVQITRIADSWTIDVNADNFQFVEFYIGKWRNRWECKIPYGAYGQFDFQTTWTRVPISSN